MPNGFWAVGVFRKVADIVDGLSNTVVLSELIPQYPAKQIANNGDFSTAGTCDTTSTDAYVYTHCWSWVNSGGYNGTALNAILTPNSPLKDCADSHGSSLDMASIKGRYAARSYHTNGVNAALGDGSVRFVTNGISLTTWQALATRAGGEAAGSDF